MCFRDFHLAGEERRVSACQLVTHLDHEAHRAGVKRALVLANVAAATFSLPPVTLLDVAGVAVKFHPRSGWQRILHVELAATRDWPINTKLHPRQPTPNVVIAFIRVDRERGDLERVFG